mmetsp:Transcript_3881/g.5607  ORF Transcript_3881/g.5607 Transcript_3881/m.5607 type:complete len:610 (+) Transcript_3881:369-2198(+)
MRYSKYNRRQSNTLSSRAGIALCTLVIFATNVGVFCFAGGRSTGKIPNQSRQQQGQGSNNNNSLLHLPAASQIPTAQSFSQSYYQQHNKYGRRIMSRLSAAASHSSSPENSNNDASEEKNEIHLRGGADTGSSSQDNHEKKSSISPPSRKKKSFFPSFDELDRKLMKIALPCIANFAINPLIGAVDLFWINRMGNALAVAGQAAANQVFNSAFWIASFLPSVTATLVSKENAKGDQEGLQDAVCQALVVGLLIALIGTPLLFFQPERILGSVLREGAPAIEYAKPYLLIRSFAFLPSLISLIGFSAFRGVLDTVTPVKISSFANMFNAILDPILIFTLSLGVPGAALATLAAEIISAVVYVKLLLQKKMIKWSKVFRSPSWSKLKPLLKGGLALQLRNVALNITFLAVTRVTQSIDDTGVAAAAHAMAIQTFQIGGIVLLALSTVAQTIVPNVMIERYDDETGETEGGIEDAKATVNRLMTWGFVLGCSLGALQIGVLPLLHKSTPLQAVRDAALVPSYLASVYQIINGLVFIGEGVMVGCGNFMQLSISTVIATVGCLWALRTFPPIFGLTGVWMGFGVFNSLRLAGVWLHQTRNGPLAPRNMDKMAT